MTIVPGPSVARPDTLLSFLPTGLEEESYLHFYFTYSTNSPLIFYTLAETGSHN